MKIIELKLDDLNTGEGITAISLVKHPAIEQSWIAFNESGGMIDRSKEYKFKTIDEEQRIVAGPAMVPDKLIYRINEEGEEFFVFFTKDTIRQLSERFFLQGKLNNVTLEHDATLNDLSVVESWIVEDPEKDKSSMYGFDLPPGSWFVKMKVLNDDVWNLVKEKSVEGFSVEGVFTRELIKNSKEMKTKKTKLDDYLNQIKGLFSDAPAEEFGTVAATDTDGAEIVINFPGEALETGAAVTVTVEDEEVPLPTGEYLLPEGLVLIVTEDGIAGEIKPVEEIVEEDLNTDGLKAEQIDKLIDGISEIISNFQATVKEDIKSAIDESAETLRTEFNKPAAKVAKIVPTDTGKKAIVQGLNKFVKAEQNK